MRFVLWGTYCDNALEKRTPFREEHLAGLQRQKDDPGRIDPQSELEMTKATAAGHDLSRIFEQDDLVAGENTYFVATGVTDGMLLNGVSRHGRYIRTESMILRSESGTIRRITADYLAERWL